MNARESATVRTSFARLLGDRLLSTFGLLVTALALIALGALIYDIMRDGLGRVSWAFLTSYPSRRAEEAGILAALAGSAFVIALTAAIAIPRWCRSSGATAKAASCWWC